MKILLKILGWFFIVFMSIISIKIFYIGASLYYKDDKFMVYLMLFVNGISLVRGWVWEYEDWIKGK